MNPEASLPSTKSAGPGEPFERTLTVPPMTGYTSDQLTAAPDVANRYKLLEEIARGGMGVIRRAYDGTLKREVALKLIHAKYAQNEGVTARFYEESRITGQL